MPPSSDFCFWLVFWYKLQRPEPSLNPGLKNSHKSAQGPIKHPFPIYHGTTTGTVRARAHTHTYPSAACDNGHSIAKPRTERVDSQDPGRKMILLSVNVVLKAVREAADTFWEWLALCSCWVIAIIIRMATTRGPDEQRTFQLMRSKNKTIKKTERDIWQGIPHSPDIQCWGWRITSNASYKHKSYKLSSDELI